MKKPTFVNGDYYHLYNHAIADKNIFDDPRDHIRFLSLLKEFNTNNHIELRRLKSNYKYNLVAHDFSQPYVKIIAYCLMSNHFHLIIEQLTDGGITNFMQKIGTGYTMYYNTRYESRGHIFSNSFLANHIQTDDQLLYTTTYVHMNPVKKNKNVLYDLKVDKEKLERLISYPWSSLPQYLNIDDNKNYAELKYLRPPINKEIINKILGQVSYKDYLFKGWINDSKKTKIDDKMA